jgi:hypothetical protein
MEEYMDVHSVLSDDAQFPLLIIPSVDGRKALSNFSDESLDVSVRFKEMRVDAPGPAKEKSLVGFFALERDARVLDAYASLGDDITRYALTPQQLGEFIVNNRSMIHQMKRSVFFLLALDGRIAGGIYIPHESRFLAVRGYELDSVYAVRAHDGYLFLVPRF